MVSLPSPRDCLDLTHENFVKFPGAALVRFLRVGPAVACGVHGQPPVLAAYQRAHAAEKAARDEAVLAGSVLRPTQASKTSGTSRNTPANPMQRRSA